MTSQARSPAPGGTSPGGPDGPGGTVVGRLALSLRLREVLAITLLTFLVVTTTTLVHLAHLDRIMLEDTLQRAELIAQQISAASTRALAAAPREDPLAVLRTDRDLRALLDASVGYSPHLLYALVTDQGRRVIVHSDPARSGDVLPERPSFQQLLEGDFVHRLHAIYRGPAIYEAVLKLDLDREPFATIRLGIATGLVRREVQATLALSATLGGLALLAALLVAIGLSDVTLRPIRQLADDMDRLRRGEFDVLSPAGPKDEFGKLAYQLHLLGRQIHTDRTRLLDERAHFQTTVDQLEDGMLFFDAERRLVFQNRAAEAVTGKPAAETRGTPLERVLGADHPLNRLVEQTFAGGARHATAVVPAPGHAAGLFASVLPVARANEACDGVIVLLRDPRSVPVSARTLQSLIRYASQLTALGQMTAAVTHEVRNALNTMAIHLEVIAGKLPRAPGDVEESLDVIRAEIRRLDGVVKKFTAVVRPQRVVLKELDLNALLEDVAALVEAEWRPKGITFATELDRSLGPVRADEELLRSAFLNVLLNACQAMPAGGRVTVTSEQEEPDGVRVTVTDTGPGIPADDLDQVFALYYTTKPDGSGLGLPLVHRIVEAHGGSIEIHSEVARGTSVAIRLPREAPR
jgi:signal transduction histidine kinase/HAMP domain-containing protein